MNQKLYKICALLAVVGGVCLILINHSNSYDLLGLLLVFGGAGALL